MNSRELTFRIRFQRTCQLVILSEPIVSTGSKYPSVDESPFGWTH